MRSCSSPSTRPSAQAMEDFILPVVQPNQIGVIDDIWLGTDNILVGQTSSSNPPQLQPESVLLESLEQAATQLQQFTEQEQFNLTATELFPDRWQPEEGLDLVHDSLIGNTGSETGLVGGEQTWWHEAYSQETETTHLSENLIQENIANPSAITTVIPEETDHYLDSKLAPGDTAGDEGARFAATIQSAATLPSWYSEQDWGTLTIDGKTVTVEYSTPEPINFHQYQLQSYVPHQDQTPAGASISSGGTAFNMVGNTWKSLFFDYSVTPNTVVELELNITETGEIQGFGFDNDNQSSNNKGNFFSLYNSDEPNDRWTEEIKYNLEESGWQHFKIPVGHYYTGKMDRLVFINDQDIANPTASSSYRNIRIYEEEIPDFQPPQEPQNLSLSNHYTILEDDHFTPLYSRSPGTYGLELRSGRQGVRGDWEIGLGTQTSVVGGFSQAQYGWEVDQQGTPTWNDFTLEWSSDTVTITLGDTVVSHHAPWQTGNAIKFYAKQNTFLEIEEIEGLPFAAEAGDVQSTIIAGENLADGWTLSGRIAMPPGKGSRHSLLVTVGNVQLDPPAPAIVLEEKSDFSPSHRETFVIPDQPSVLGFDYDITFDTTDPDSINDAFEVALVDQTGQSLVHTIQREQDAFFNLTEGETPNLAPGVTQWGETITVNLTDVAPGTEGNLILRLVNNDGDINTAVTIRDIDVWAANDAIPVDIPSSNSLNNNNNNPIDFSSLVDVTPSINTQYQQTSFNQETNTLTANLALVNNGTYHIHSPLILAIKNISDPSIRALNADGVTASGLPYYDFSNLISGEQLAPGATSQTKEISFYNPNQTQFTYELAVLSTLNNPPLITSQPDEEIVAGKTYTYQVTAEDKDRDPLTYSLLTASPGMAIDAATGLITWETTLEDLANHPIVVEVTDGRGGKDLQTYNLAVIDIPNRPPNFTSTPVVDTYINQPYNYDADAVDPDKDPVTYEVITAPEGLTINPNTGEIEWTPPAVVILGDTIFGQINIPGERDEFTFSGTAGQNIYFDPLQYSGNYNNWNFHVYSPSGQRIVDTNLLYNHNQLIQLPETGNYRIVVDASGNTTGNYGFSVIDIALTPIAQFDTAIEGQLSPGAEDDIYRFSGNQGQRLFIDEISNSNNVDWVLYDSKNEEITSHYYMDDLEVVLPRDGEYKLALRGRGSFNTTVDYAFEIITPDEITRTIELGSIDLDHSVYGEITEKGERDFNTFEGRVGQAIFFDRLFLNSTHYNSHTINLIEPRGQTIWSRNLSSGDDTTPILLSETGTYQVRIDASGENTGSYSFNLLDFDQATTIHLDTKYTQTLNPGQETHIYQFDTVEGQRLFIDSIQPTSTYFRLYNSNFQEIQSPSSDIEIVTPKSATYYLVVQGRNNNATSYQFEIITPDEITSEMNLGSIDSPQTVNGAITEKGERDFYTFSGTIGQRIYFDHLAINSTNHHSHTINLIDPRGQTVWTRNLTSHDDLTPLLLSENGTYQVRIDASGENTGTYSFNLLDFHQAQPLENDITYSHTLNPSRETHLYQFNSEAGQRLYLDTAGGTSGAHWTLYDAANNKIQDVGLNNDIELVLDRTGTYTLAVRGQSSNSPVNYSFSLINPQTVTEELTFNQAITGAITQKGEQDIYTFTGEQGQKLFLDTLIDNNNIKVTLIDSQGHKLLDNVALAEDETRNPFNLSLGGDYRLIVDGSGETTGNYNFQLYDFSNATQLTPNSPITGQINPGSTIQVYQLTGYEGMRVYFQGSDSSATSRVRSQRTTLPSISSTTLPSISRVRSQRTTLPSISSTTLPSISSTTLPSDSNSSTPNWLLYSPGNNQLVDTTLNQDFQWVFQSNETHYLIIRGDGNFTDSFPYQFQIIPTLANPTAENLPFNHLTTGTIEEIGQQKTYSFHGTVGQQLYFDGQGSHQFTATILTPGGQEIFNGNVNNDSNNLILAETGTYQVVIDGVDDTTGNYNFRLANLADIEILPLDTTITGTLAAQETKLYQLDSTAGNKLELTAQSLAGDADWILYGPGTKPNGSTTIASAEIDSNLTTFLPLESRDNSPYTLAIRNFSDAAINFGFTATLTESPEVTNSGMGETISGSYGVGETKQHQFTAAAGTLIILDGLSTTSRIRTTLVRPDGTEIFSNHDTYKDTGVYLLDQSGEYTVKVFDYHNNANRSYQFQILDLATAPEINLQEVISGDFGTTKLETDLYRFSGEAGQRIFFNRISGDYHNQWGLYTDSGVRLNWTRLDYDNRGGDFEQTLPYTGEYVIRLSSVASSNNNYSFELLENQWSTTQYTLGQTISGADISIGEPGDRDTYTFSGTAGQRLYFDSLEASHIYIDWKLTDPNGKVIFNEDVKNDKLITLTETGNYTLNIDGVGHNWYGYQQYQDATGSYGFRIFDWSDLPSINLDEVVSGDFGPGKRETDLYRFSGEAGQRIFFNRISGASSSSSNYWGLYTDAGVRLNWTQFRLYNDLGDFERTLPYTGEYILRLSGNGDNSNTYSFNLITNSWSHNQYTIGSTVSGADISIFEPGDRDNYTFSGTAGQKLYFDSLEDSHQYIDWKLIDPNGRIVFNDDVKNDKLITLTETGSYTLNIDGVGANWFNHQRSPDITGSYGFRILDWSDLPSINLEEVVSGDFGPGKLQTDLYRFSGEAGQRIFFNRISGDDRNEWGLYTDSGVRLNWTRLGFAYGRGGDFERTLPYTGEYVIRLSGSNRNNNNYSFELLENQWSTTQYTIGDTISGTDISIFEPGDRDTYTFSGTAGQRLYFDSLENSDSSIDWQLTDPNGKVIFNEDVRNDQFITLTKTGNYTLNIDGVGYNWYGYQQYQDVTGSYGFRIFDWSELPSINLEEVVSGDFGPGKLQTDLYRFSGEAGQRIFFNRISGDDHNEWGLYTDSGVRLNWTKLGFAYGRGGDFERTLPYTGEYVIRLSGSNRNNNNYSFELLENQWSTTEYTLGQTVSGADISISEPGDRDTYTFSGTAGQRLYFDSLEASNQYIDWKLTDPNGKVIFNEDVKNDKFITLTATGNYTLNIDGVGYNYGGYQQYQDATGSYGFRILDWSDLPSINLEEVVSGDFGSNKRETHLYSFRGQAGQRLLFDRTIGNSHNNWGLYNSKGQLITAWERLSDDFESTLPATDDYVLRLTGNGNNDSNYSFQIISSELVTTALTLGEVVSSQISKGGEQDTYTPHSALRFATLIVAYKS